MKIELLAVIERQKSLVTVRESYPAPSTILFLLPLYKNLSYGDIRFCMFHRLK